MAISKVSDPIIIKQVSQRLMSRGIRNPCLVQVQSRSGDVTLTGTVQFEHQRKGAGHLVSGVSGVRRVINQLLVKPQVRRDA